MRRDIVVEISKDQQAISDRNTEVNKDFFRWWAKSCTGNRVRVFNSILSTFSTSLNASWWRDSMPLALEAARAFRLLLARWPWEGGHGQGYKHLPLLSSSLSSFSPSSLMLSNRLCICARITHGHTTIYTTYSNGSRPSYSQAQAKPKLAVASSCMCTRLKITPPDWGPETKTKTKPRMQTWRSC